MNYSPLLNMYLCQMLNKLAAQQIWHGEYLDPCKLDELAVLNLLRFG